MATAKLSKLEYRVMEALWARGELSIREIQETFPQKAMPAYTTIQTTVYRMENKGIVRRTGKVGNFHIFVPNLSREEAQRKLIDDLLAFFGGQSQPVMAHLIDSGKLSLAEVKEAERALEKMQRGKARK